jgi:hypothetical protein
MKKVLVKWYDTEALPGWKHETHVANIVKDGLDVAESTGFLYKKNSHLVAIVQSRHLTNVSELLMIPRSCVISIKKLKGDKK